MVDRAANFRAVFPLPAPQSVTACLATQPRTRGSIGVCAIREVLIALGGMQEALEAVG